VAVSSVSQSVRDSIIESIIPITELSKFYDTPNTVLLLNSN